MLVTSSGTNSTNQAILESPRKERSDAEGLFPTPPAPEKVEPKLSVGPSIGFGCLPQVGFCSRPRSVFISSHRRFSRLNRQED